MSKKVHLFNKGKRTILGKHVDGTKFALVPQVMGRFDEETAARIQKLYPTEVQSLEQMQRQFQASMPKDEPDEAPAPAAAPQAEAAPVDPAAEGAALGDKANEAEPLPEDRKRGILGIFGKKAPAAGEGDTGTDGVNAGQADASGQGGDAA